MDKQSVLDEIFSNDPFGMLNVKPSAGNSGNDDERFLASFRLINDFYEQHNQEPNKVSEDVQEYQLAVRLHSIRASETKVEMLKKHDVFDLLAHNKLEINSLDDIFEHDMFGMLEDDTQGLFDFKHIEKPDKDRTEADFVARRQPCQDFDKYEHLFRAVQADLKSGKRKLVNFKLGNLREGAYYVHNGVVFLLEEINIKHKEHYRDDGTRVREDGRTRCVFENGTESNMLRRSVEKILYANGKAISENADEVAENFSKKTNPISNQDQQSGYIYVLESKSESPAIQAMEHLYKIGFSKGVVETRIKNAREDPTYLMADVRIVQTYQCYNLNPQQLEQLLHTFFGAACLNVDVFDNNNQRHTPREWFVAPLPIIEQAIALVLSGNVVNYKYDSKSKQITEKTVQ